MSIDLYGLYVQKDLDTGDSLLRSSLASVLQHQLGDQAKSLATLNTIIKFCEVSHGILVRHPYPPYSNCQWQANPRCTSRDQASRFILACAVNGYKSAIMRWVKAMVRRFGFHQNNLTYDTGKWKVPDIIGIGEVANVIRGLDLWYLYPLLLLLDLNLPISFLLRSRFDGASLVVCDVIYAAKKYPTMASIYAYKMILNDYEWQAEVSYNYAPRTNGCLEVGELFAKLREKLDHDNA